MNDIQNSGIYNRLQCQNCSSFDIVKNAEGFLVCQNCGIESDSINFEELTNFNQISQYYPFFQNDLGSIIGYKKNIVNIHVFRKLMQYQKRSLTYEDKCANIVLHLFLDLQETYHLPLDSSEFIRYFWKYFSRVQKFSKFRNLTLITCGVYYRLGIQLGSPLDIKKILLQFGLNLSKYFSLIKRLNILFKMEQVGTSHEAEEKLLLSIIIDLHCPNEIFIDAKKNLSLNDTFMDGKMKLRVGKALIGALNKADLFNHSQFRVYKIAKLLGISQSALYRNKNMIKRRLKQI